MRFPARCLYALTWAALTLPLGCTSTPVAPKEAEPAVKLSPEDQKRFAEYQAEVTVGRNMAGRLLAAFGSYQDESLVGYVNQVGNYVASYSDFPDRRYMFQILDTDMVNAFACPGGYILVTLGTIRLAKNEAELAAVLGHEVTHVGKRHMFNTLQKMSKAEVEKDEKANARPVDLPESVLVRERPKAQDSATGSLLARYLMAGSNAGLSVLQAAHEGMTLILEKGLDKNLEFEADDGGVTDAVRAGYEPKALLNYLERMKKDEKKLDLSVLNRTHPKISDRQARIDDILKKMDADAIVGATGKARFGHYAEQIRAPRKSDD